MNTLDFYIWVAIAVIGCMVYVSVLEILSIEISIAAVGILAALLTYLLTTKQDKRAMTIVMILLDERKRALIELLEKPKTVDEVIMWSSKMGKPETRAQILDLITSLEKRGFVKKRRSEEGIATYQRAF